MAMATTTISSKGQLVIPQSIRDELGINEGDSFIVQAKDDVILLRKLEDLPPKARKTVEMLQEAWKEIESGKFTKTDADTFLKRVRQWST